jgi:hypothetical protein
MRATLLYGLTHYKSYRHKQSYGHGYRECLSGTGCLSLSAEDHDGMRDGVGALMVGPLGERGQTADVAVDVRGGLVTLLVPLEQDI